LNLIPAEYWEYGIGDLIHGITAASGENIHHEISLPGLGSCFTIGSGRAALIIALRALNLKPGAHVGVPLYCCPVVLRAIELADCSPQFVDIESDTFCISAQDLSRKIDRLDAVIALHMFGNMCDMQILRTIAKDKPVIEDCAQALGSRINDGMAGSFGDIAFFSFRSGKYLSVGEGGAVFSTNEEFCDRIRKLVKFLQDTSYWDDILHIFKTYIRSKLRSEPLYGLVGHQLWTFYNKIADHSVKTSMSINNIYKSDRAIAAKRLKYIDTAIAKQRDNARFYTQNLKFEQGMICMEKPGKFYNRYLYPIVFPSLKQRDSMSVYMHKRGIGTTKPYHDISSIATKHHGYRGDCPVSEKIADCVIAIPNHHNLKEEDRQHVALCLNKGWMAIRNK
jgi:dTDP-4-amino-4,6-dideoxygalactose transaminase